MLFSSAAIAADPANFSATPEPPGWINAAPIVLIVAMLYLLIIRPQQKKIKDHETMVKALRRGDKVITGGGVIGVIYKVEDDDVLVVEVAENMRLRVMRDTISGVVTKMPVANDNKADKNADKDKSNSK